uniref:Spermatogenesis associated 1 n=1 Tax=Sphaeramia orbicularis TaxID=375764 RepID=A0A673CAR5_9TELE
GLGMELRPASCKFVELHVLYVPDDQWNVKLNKVPVEAIESFISAGFIRVYPDLTLKTLRNKLAAFLGAERSINKFSFLKCVGHSLALVSADACFLYCFVLSTFTHDPKSGFKQGGNDDLTFVVMTIHRMMGKCLLGEPLGPYSPAMYVPVCSLCFSFNDKARDSWKKKYFETKKATAPLEDNLRNLRQELEIFYTKLLHQLHARENRGKPKRQGRTSIKVKCVMGSIVCTYQKIMINLLDHQTHMRQQFLPHKFSLNHFICQKLK